MTYEKSCLTLYSWVLMIKCDFLALKKNKLACFTYPVKVLIYSNKFVQTDISQSTKKVLFRLLEEFDLGCQVEKVLPQK